MPRITLTDAERLSLMRVLDLNLSYTRKSTPMLQPLSLYSSELKGTKQIAKSLNAIRTTGQLADSSISRDRYFNSLSNQALVEGSSSTPKLTPLSSFYLDAWGIDTKEEFWQGNGGDGVELEVIRELVKRLRTGQPVSDAFKLAWFNAQTFFDNVPSPDLSAVLSDRDRLLALFRINSNGWEIARYFRLNQAERQAFDEAFSKVIPTDHLTPSTPIEVAAAQYKDAAKSIQPDVRFRISGFLNSYNQLRSQLDSDLPRLDRQLVLRAGASGGGSGNLLGQGPLSTTAIPLSHPHQLIVTGCPGSGKSHYVDQLINSTGCAVYRTQFHPESSFFDFVGAYKPIPVYEPFDESQPLLEGGGSVYSRGKPLIDYRFVPGPLMQGLVHAITYPHENVVVLIEEINRGNAAAIFGDILQLLDRNDKGVSRYEVMAAPELRAFLAGAGHPLEAIRLTANLYLWATMNSADQGVFPLDTAFRRRWSYVYKGYAEPCVYPAKLVYGGKTYGWDAFRNALNHALLELGIHEDKLIGPYFLTEQQLSDPASILEKLFLYLWEDVLRFRQNLLFKDKSFSLVSVVWANGVGTPLNLNLPTPLLPIEGASQPPELFDDEPVTVSEEPAQI